MRMLPWEMSDFRAFAMLRRSERQEMESLVLAGGILAIDLQLSFRSIATIPSLAF